MTQPGLIAALQAALAQLTDEPIPLGRTLKGWEVTHDQSFPADQDTLAHELESESPAGSLRGLFRERLARWDNLPTAGAAWTRDTRPHTVERRELIYELLKPTDRLLGAFRNFLKPVINDDRSVVIEHGGYEPWYTNERKAGSSFYWTHYSAHLRTKRWPAENIEALDEASSWVVQRLTDPCRKKERQVKGLVVGHVQSGKTANLTAVIAKAADAGYRLIIVLSGMTDLLRNQTQRRLDMELIGKESIRPDAEGADDEDLDYATDDAWDSFISHGGRPVDLGAFDWVRLTGERWDYKRLKAGIQSLEFDRADKSEPYYTPENLRGAPAKVMIVKKQAGRLKNVYMDLKRIQTRLADVPALIIDDESDQASVNTARPQLTKEDRKKRTRINQCIVDLIKILPRAQYVGYTATPFANVLIDANDQDDLFPRDFIISLAAPPEYLGATAFHDLAGVPPGADENPYVSNELCFVRNVVGDDDETVNLPEAIDAFVLSGAVKLWRAQEEVDGKWTHHTMLVHASQYTEDQRQLKELCEHVFNTNGYDTATASVRLEGLWERDHRRVSNARADGMPTPPTWAEIKPFVGRAVAKIRSGDGPAIEVNGTDRGEDPNFDQQAVWRIVVGGAKLSRGYTIEGLTVSYFRRRATAGDALMQMGRWFGYPQGYRDLVRLYISREEAVGTRKYDLYEAFEAVCRDEELFRAQLQRYALDDAQDAPIRPIDVPPLVYSHLEWLPPVPKNKRLNAVIDFENLGGEWREPTMAPLEADRVVANSQLFTDFLERREPRVRSLAVLGESFDAIIATAEPAEIIALLERYKWAKGFEAIPLTRIIEFLRGTGKRDPQINSWLIIAPQLKQQSQVAPWIAGPTEFSVKRRARVSPDGARVKAYSEPTHRESAAQIAGTKKVSAESELHGLNTSQRAVMLFYPAHHLQLGEEPPDSFVPTMGFALHFPNNTLAHRLTLRTRVTHVDKAFVTDAEIAAAGGVSSSS